MVSVVHHSQLGDDSDGHGFDVPDRPQVAGSITSEGPVTFHVLICRTAGDSKYHALNGNNGRSLCGDEVQAIYPLMDATDLECGECREVVKRFEERDRAAETA